MTKNPNSNEPASLKRKRNLEKFMAGQPLIDIKEDKAAAAAPLADANVFTNAAFSSTPKKLMARRRKSCVPLSGNPFLNGNGMEFKSIKDFVSNVAAEVTPNPYEVVRKPPKKKRQTEENSIESACFVNPALNLEAAEKQFNPFEVITY